MKKENRIKKNAEIADIVLKKQRVGNEFFTIYYQPSTTNFRVAISVSKKYGNSVERNHAKRIIRELVRPNLKKYQPINLVIVVKQNLKNTQFNVLKANFDYFLKKIEKRLNFKENQ